MFSKIFIWVNLNLKFTLSGSNKPVWLQVESMCILLGKLNSDKLIQ